MTTFPEYRPAAWCLYLLECQGGSYYAGITNDLDARYAAHRSGKGARYTRANPPVRIVASKAYADRSAASVAEAKLKRMPRAQKLSFFMPVTEKGYHECQNGSQA